MQTGPYYMQYDFIDKWAIFLVKFQRTNLIYHTKIKVYKIIRLFGSGNLVSCMKSIKLYFLSFQLSIKFSS